MQIQGGMAFFIHFKGMHSYAPCTLIWTQMISTSAVFEDPWALSAIQAQSGLTPRKGFVFRG